MAIEVKIRDKQEPIHVVNVYNAPHGCTEEDKAVTNVMNLASLIQKHTIIAGDFNLHHGDWDQQAINPTPQAIAFTEWMTTNGGEYGLTSGIVTHQRGGAIDVVITSGALASQIKECYTDNNLDLSSDHKVIITTVELEVTWEAFHIPGKFQLGKLDEKMFISTITSQKDILQRDLELAKLEPGYSSPRKIALNQCVEKITMAIYKRLEVSTPRPQNSGHGEL